VLVTYRKPSQNASRMLPDLQKLSSSHADTENLYLLCPYGSLCRHEAHLLKRKGHGCFLDLKQAPMQDNTLADRPMVELLTMLMHMLDLARHSASQRAGGSAALQQLVLILADGRFHEKESLRRVVEVTLAHWRFSISTGGRMA
jgi:hypothetical protein